MSWVASSRAASHGEVRSYRSIAGSSRAVIVAGLTVVTACFSGRSVPTDTGGSLGDCQVPLTAEVLGATLVAVRGFAFRGPDTRVARGARVAWINCEASATAHTVTADDGSFDSQQLDPGKAYVRSFPTAGSFAYHCEPHPFMKGRVIVE